MPPAPERPQPHGKPGNTGSRSQVSRGHGRVSGREAPEESELGVRGWGVSKSTLAHPGRGDGPALALGEPREGPVRGAGCLFLPWPPPKAAGFCVFGDSQSGSGNAPPCCPRSCLIMKAQTWSHFHREIYREC